jgi:Na+(H+)/acetate symporter ActP
LCLYSFLFRNREARAIYLLKDTRKDRMICDYRFSMVHHHTCIQNITFWRKNDKDKKKEKEKLVRQKKKTGFIKKICAIRQKHMIQVAKNEQKLSGVSMLFCFTNNKCQMAYIIVKFFFVRYTFT